MESHFKNRKIIHIDMDAFYASVEQREHSRYRGKPLIVGGDPKSRGVVCAASYEARKFGIKSAMPSSYAYRLCPQAIFVQPNFSLYSAVSSKIMKILKEFTDKVEPLSLDEAYLDVTENKKNCHSATILAEEIRKIVKHETKLTASAGVSYNKFLAKIASDINKPDGLAVITPEEAESFLDTLPVGKFVGIGKVTEAKLKEIGVFIGADLKKYNKIQMWQLFGKSGDFFYNIVRGIDTRDVISNHVRKSYGREETFQEDILDISEVKNRLYELSTELALAIQRDDLRGKTLTLKVKYSDFKVMTRSFTEKSFIPSSAEWIFTLILKLLQKTEAGKRKIRLLGISISNFPEEKEESTIQLELPFLEVKK